MRVWRVMTVENLMNSDTTYVRSFIYQSCLAANL